MGVLNDIKFKIIHKSYQSFWYDFIILSNKHNISTTINITIHVIGKLLQNKTMKYTMEELFHVKYFYPTNRQYIIPIILISVIVFVHSLDFLTT